MSQSEYSSRGWWGPIWGLHVRTVDLLASVTTLEPAALLFILLDLFPLTSRFFITQVNRYAQLPTINNIFLRQNFHISIVSLHFGVNCFARENKIISYIS